MTSKTRYQTDVLERFIPVSLDRLISDLLSSKTIATGQNQAFQQFCNSYTKLFHAQAYYPVTMS